MGSDDDKTFKANFSSEGVLKLTQTVRDKLKEFMGEYTDDTLVEYVIVLLKNGRHKEEAKSELNVFLGDDSDSFVTWLWDHLSSHLPLYVHHTGSNVRSVVAELPENSNILLHRRKKGLKSIIRDSVEQNSPRARRKRSSSPQKKRKRREEAPQNNAPRRLLQFAVRDAVETCKQLEVSKETQQTKRLKSVVSNDSVVEPVLPKVEPPPPPSPPRVPPPVIKTKQRISVFDRIGRDVEQYDDEGNGIIAACTSQRDEQMKGNPLLRKGALQTAPFSKPVVDGRNDATKQANAADDVESRTIFVNNVNFSATKDSLSRHFAKCGEILKVTILTDVATRQPIGSAYVEFGQKAAADKSIALDGSVFLSRMLKVTKKVPRQTVTWQRRVVRPTFPRAAPAQFRGRGLVKKGGRSLQWKRGENQTSGADVAGLTHRSLTYIRPELKTGANVGTGT